MSRVLTLREKAIIGVALAAALCVAVDRVWIFRAQYFRSLDDRAGRLMQELRLARSVLTEKTAINQAEAELFPGRDVTKPEDAAILMSGLDKLAHESGVNVTNLRPAAGGDTQAVAVVFEGDWASTVKFLSAAQARPNFFDIRELRIIRKNFDQQRLEVEGALFPVRI
jgi:hypothetical protein